MATTSATAVQGQAPNTAGKRIPELDGVRGLAILLVLFYHYANVSVPGNRALTYAFLPTQLMWSGVDLFFVLSGLLIGGILLDHRESPNYYSVFYARRIYRIFPLYYLMVALLAVGVWVFPLSPLFAGSIPLWAYPLYAQNLMGDFTQASPWLGVTWSLAVEEQFYLLFPFAVRMCSRKALMALLGICIFGAPVLRTLLVMNGWRFENVYPLLPCRADALALGVAAAIIIRSEAAKAWIRANSRLLYVCLLVLLAITPTMLKWRTYEYVGTIGYSLLGVMYFLLIVLVLIAPTPVLTKVFRIRWLGWLGLVSYCVYLIHDPIRFGLFLLFGLGEKPSITGWATLLVTLASLVVTFAIAQASWVVLEKRLTRRAHQRYHY